MSKPVFYVPGLLGSELLTFEPVLPDLLWVNKARLALGQITQLTLAPRGYLPLEGVGAACRPGGPLPDYYGRAAGALRAGLNSAEWDVIEWGYDWRLSLLYTGQRLAVAIAARSSAGEPATIVAHSQGGLVARLAWYSLVQQGKSNLVRRIVTIATPHEGSYSAALALLGHDEVVDQIQLAETFTAGLGQALGGFTSPAGLPHSKLEIARIIQSWPSIYQLLPLLLPGWQFEDPNRAALYGSAAYPAGPAFSTTHADYARGPLLHVLDSLASKPPTSVLLAVAARQYSTPCRLLSPVITDPVKDFAWNDEGDGRVTVRSAIPPWAKGEVVTGTHGDVMSRQSVLQALPEWVRRVIPENTGPTLLPTSLPSLQPVLPPNPIHLGPPLTQLPPLWYDP